MDCKGDFKAHIAKHHESVLDLMGEASSSTVAPAPMPWQAALYPISDWDITQEVDPNAVSNEVIQAWEGCDETALE